MRKKWFITIGIIVGIALAGFLFRHQIDKWYVNQMCSVERVPGSDAGISEHTLFECTYNN